MGQKLFHCYWGKRAHVSKYQGERHAVRCSRCIFSQLFCSLQYNGLLVPQCFFFNSLSTMTWPMKILFLGKKNSHLMVRTKKGWSRSGLWHRNHFGSCPAIPAASYSCSLLWRQLKTVTHWQHISAKTPTQPSCHHRCTPFPLMLRDLLKTSLGE